MELKKNDFKIVLNGLLSSNGAVLNININLPRKKDIYVH